MIYPPSLTRGIQIGLGLFVVLLAAVGYGASHAGTDRPGLGLGGPVTEYPSAAAPTAAEQDVLRLFSL